MKRRVFVAGFGALAATAMTGLPDAAFASKDKPKLGLSIRSPLFPRR